MSRKPHLVPATLSREEALERRIADLERAVRSLPVRQQQAAASGTSQMILQAAHGLAAGDVVRYNGTAWVKALADVPVNACYSGIVSSVPSANVFVLSTYGPIVGLSGLSSGNLHYLSGATAGAMTTTPAKVPVPVLIATSTTTGMIIPFTAGWQEFDICDTATGTVKNAYIPRGAFF